jgi:hypothetical protein
MLKEKIGFSDNFNAVCKYKTRLKATFVKIIIVVKFYRCEKGKRG